VTIAVDVAASHFFDGSHYRLAATGGEQLTSAQLGDALSSLVEQCLAKDPAQRAVAGFGRIPFPLRRHPEFDCRAWFHPP